ncbi:MAG: TetR/AcrR family transcriptional regulator [Clostridia bacterium]|jgi:TetR/AcrR family fatty acid metabolism transcriptional regulator|nr:TetR/AcrR family transcriptional regulator [Clostridia bacterium]MCL6522905.1 TetR family transcriptional regulator [Bacillota bacterium]
MSRPQQAERYREILRAAVHVIAARGYHGARISDIAREAGVADGTVYLYFRNKQEVLIAVFRDGIGRYLRNLEERLEGAADAREELGILVETHLGDLGSRREFAQVTQIELRQSDGEIRRAIDAIMDPYFRRIDRIIERGREEGVFLPDVDRRVARRMIFGTLDQCVTSWVMSRHPYDLASIAPEVTRLLLGGLERR